MIKAAIFKSTGFAELDRKLEFMHTAAANRISTAAIRAGLRVAAIAIRKQIPATIQRGILQVDKGIGVTTKRKSSNGASGKVGVGVGNTQKKALSVKNRGRRKGEGVSARNLHWFAMGTVDRYTGSVRDRRKGVKKGTRISTGKPRKFTGRIDKSKFGNFVQRGMASSASAVFQAMAKSVQRNLELAAGKGVAGALEGLTGGD